MSKIARSDKDYDSGSGREIYRSLLFRVAVWHMSGGIRTTLDCELTNNEIVFDGEVELFTDDQCMEQLYVKEIIDMIDAQKRLAFEEGMCQKAREIRNCLGLDYNVRVMPEYSGKIEV